VEARRGGGWVIGEVGRGGGRIDVFLVVFEAFREKVGEAWDLCSWVRSERLLYQAREVGDGGCMERGIEVSIRFHKVLAISRYAAIGYKQEKLHRSLLREEGFAICESSAIVSGTNFTGQLLSSLNGCHL